LYSQNSENIGIGTLSPKSALNIVNDNAGQNILTVYDEYYSPFFYAKPNGAISIGSSSPQAWLTLRSSEPISLLNLIQENTSTPVGMSFSNSDGQSWQIRSFIPSAGLGASAYWKLNYFPTGNLLTIRGNGNVGVRNETPNYTLDVTGNIGLSGRILPNGLSGNNADILVSDGPYKAPKWVNPLTIENNKYIFNKTYNSGSTTSTSPILISSQSFSTNDDMKVEVSFGTYVATSFSSTSDICYGQIDIELWNTTTNTFLTKFQTHFKTLRNSPQAISANKVFSIIHTPVGVWHNYEVRCRLKLNEGNEITYGHTGILIATPLDGKFLSVKLIKK
jgi:hypothetical protein